MASKRLLRINEQLKREISGILRTQVRDPRVGTVTVTGVEVTPDLMQARVHVRLPGEDEEGRDTALEGLEAAAPWVRRQLGEELRLRRIPELLFEEDRTLEHAMRIEELLREVVPGDDDADEGPDDDADDDAGNAAGDDAGSGDAPDGR